MTFIRLCLLVLLTQGILGSLCVGHYKFIVDTSHSIGANTWNYFMAPTVNKLLDMIAEGSYIEMILGQNLVYDSPTEVTTDLITGLKSAITARSGGSNNDADATDIYESQPMEGFHMTAILVCDKDSGCTRSHYSQMKTLILQHPDITIITIQVLDRNDEALQYYAYRTGGSYVSIMTVNDVEAKIKESKFNEHVGCVNECILGYYFDEECIECPVGSSCDGHKKTLCEPGYYSNEPGSYECYDCQPGYYCIDGISHKCEANYFSNYTFSECILCPANFSCTEGEPMEHCKEGQFSDIGSGVCHQLLYYLGDTCEWSSSTNLGIVKKRDEYLTEIIEGEYQRFTYAETATSFELTLTLPKPPSDLQCLYLVFELYGSNGDIVWFGHFDFVEDGDNLLIIFSHLLEEMKRTELYTNYEGEVVHRYFIHFKYYSSESDALYLDQYGSVTLKVDPTTSELLLIDVLPYNMNNITITITTDVKSALSLCTSRHPDDDTYCNSVELLSNTLYYYEDDYLRVKHYLPFESDAGVYYMSTGEIFIAYSTGIDPIDITSEVLYHCIDNCMGNIIYSIPLYFAGPNISVIVTSLITSSAPRMLADTFEGVQTTITAELIQEDHEDCPGCGSTPIALIVVCSILGLIAISGVIGLLIKIWKDKKNTPKESTAIPQTVM